MKSKKSSIERIVSGFVAFAFFLNVIISPTPGFAQNVPMLPAPGAMVSPSISFTPLLLKGMTIYPNEPFKFDFIIDSGNTDLNSDEMKKESQRLVKYFLASMTLPKDDLWVNLSPFEKDRIIPQELGKTELGRDMLGQDYILKQLTASLMYPEEGLGKQFWSRIYKEAMEKFGTSEIPVDTFNKVWIVPEEASVYEHEATVYIVKSRLKVMLEEDYLAFNASGASSVERIAYGESNSFSVNAPLNTQNAIQNKEANDFSTQIIREVIIPAIEKEVNEGKNFAPLRQIYHSLILAQWYKDTVKESLLSQIYVDKRKIGGVDIDDIGMKDKIYNQYLEAYKKGVYDYIKEEYDAKSQEIIPRKYFSGGIKGKVVLNRTHDLASLAKPEGESFKLEMRIEPKGKTGGDRAMLALPDANKYLDELQRTRDIAGDRKRYADYGKEIDLAEINKRSKGLRDFWSQFPQNNIPYSSGYGLSAVTFVPEHSALYRNITRLMDALSKTKAAKEKKLILSDPKRLHMTVYQLETGGENSIPNNRVQNIKSGLKQSINATAVQIATTGEQHPLRVVYGKDVFISPKARIGINGYKEGTGLDSLRASLQNTLGHERVGAKGEHINIASIIKDLDQQELNQIYLVIDVWKSDGRLSGFLETDDVKMVFHKDDHLSQIWGEDEKFVVGRNQYDQYASKLTDLIGLTEKELDEALPGRRDKKYDPDTFEALPFEGISVIHNIEPKEAEGMKLSTMAQEFRKMLIDAGLKHMIAFVDLTSFHATTFDLINEPETRKAFAAQKGQKRYSYAKVRKHVEEATRQFLINGDGKGYSAPKLNAKVKITGIGMFTPGIVKLNLQMVDKLEFSVGEFSGSMTLVALIEAIQTRGIAIPNANTPIESLNKLLEDQYLYRVMKKRPANTNALISQLEKGQKLSPLEIKRLNRDLIEANYPLKTPKRPKNRFEEFRQRLQTYLEKKVPGYKKLVRKKVGTLAGHITFGYTMNAISMEEIEKFIQVLKGFNEKFQSGGQYAGIEFDLTQGEITRFTSMDHYDHAMLSNEGENIDQASLTTFTQDQEDLLKEVHNKFTFGPRDQNREQKLKLSPTDVLYTRQMWRKKLDRVQGRGTQPFKIVLNEAKWRLEEGIEIDFDKDGNFILDGALTDQERKEYKGTFSHDEIKNDPANARSARNVIVTLNSMDGGIGEALNRLLFLQRRQERGENVEVKLSAKGTDLGYYVRIKGKEVFVSIAEAKLLQLLFIAQKNLYQKILLEPLVNYQSKESYRKLFQKTYLFDRLDTTIARDKKRSYRKILKENGIKILRMREQADLPAFDKDNNLSVHPSDKAKQPGGHGYWGFTFLWDLYKKDIPQDAPRIRVFYNGDNLNSRVNEHIVGWMARGIVGKDGVALHKIPIVKLTTTALGADRKGGKDGLRVERIDGETVYIPDQMEVADAKAADANERKKGKEASQLSSFRVFGLKGGLGQERKQSFNTNIFYINESVLSPFLKDLVKEGILTEDELQSIISPSLIDKPAKEIDGERYIPIDGAIGTAIHSLNAYILRHKNNPKIKIQAILKKHNIDRLLYFDDDVPRTPFFTPVKHASDMYHQAQTDYYHFNTDEWILENSRPGLEPPEFRGVSDEDEFGSKDASYWKEYQNWIDNFGKLDIFELKSFTLDGKVKIRDARLIGNIEIFNKGKEIVDLASERYRNEYPQLFEGGQLVLRNTTITILEDGSLRLKDKNVRQGLLSDMKSGKAGFVMVKPDGMPFKEEIISLLQANGLEVFETTPTKFTEEQAKAFYRVHQGKDFYKGLVDHITSGPVMFLFVRKEEGNVITLIRALQTAIRKYHGVTSRNIQNILHASDSIGALLYETGVAVFKNQLQTLHEDPTTGLSEQNIKDIFNRLGRKKEEGGIPWRGEDVDVIKVENGKEVVIGPVDMSIVHSYGLMHRTSNAFIVTPEGKILLQRRVHNSFLPLSLSIFGGHVRTSYDYEDTIKKEIKEELDLPKYWVLEGQFVRVGEEGSFESPADESNKERRSLYFYYATAKELEEIRRSAQRLEDLKKTMTREKFKEWLEEEQRKQSGAGETWGIHEFSLFELLSAGQRGSVELTDLFIDGELKEEAPLTADLLAPLLKNLVIVPEQRRLTLEERSLKASNYPDLYHAIMTLVYLQAKAGTQNPQTGKWGSFFKIIEDGKTVDYGVYKAGSSKAYLGEVPQEEVKSADFIFIQNVARAGRPGRAGVQPRVDPEDSNMTKLVPGNVKKDSPDEYWLEWTGPSGHAWWIMGNPFAIWPFKNNAPLDSQPYHLTVSRSDKRVLQNEMHTIDNIRDTLELFDKLNTSPGLENKDKFRISINGWYYSDAPDADKAGASQSQAHAQLIRFVFPIERAELSDTRHQISPVTASSLNDGMGTGIVLEAARDQLEYISQVTAKALELITAKGHSFNVLVAPTEDNRVRIFIADRVKGTPEPHFTNEWAFAEFGRAAIIDDPRIFYQMNNDQRKNYSEFVDSKKQQEAIAWVKKQKQDGMLSQVSPDLYQKAVDSLNVITAPQGEIDTLISALASSLAMLLVGSGLRQKSLDNMWDGKVAFGLFFPSAGVSQEAIIKDLEGLGVIVETAPAVQLDNQRAQEFLEEHRGEANVKDLEAAITSGDVVPLFLKVKRVDPGKDPLPIKFSEFMQKIEAIKKKYGTMPFYISAFIKEAVKDSSIVFDVEDPVRREMLNEVNNDSFLDSYNKKHVMEKLALSWPLVAKGQRMDDFFNNDLKRNERGRYVIQRNAKRRMGRVFYNVIKTVRGKLEPTFISVINERFGALRYMSEREKKRYAPRMVADEEVWAFDAPGPLAKGHLIMLPNMLAEDPQFMEIGAIKVALSLLKRVPYKEHLKVGFNGYGAWASVNELHLQPLFYEDVNGQASSMPVEKHAGEKGNLEKLRDINGVNISLLKNYPVNGFVLTAEDIDRLSGVANRVVGILQGKNIAHNLIFTRLESGQFRVYIFPREFQEPSTLGTGIAFFEIGGEIVVLKERSFEFLWREIPDYKALVKKFIEKKGENDFIYEQLAEETKAKIDVAAGSYVDRINGNNELDEKNLSAEEKKKFNELFNSLKEAIITDLNEIVYDETLTGRYEGKLGADEIAKIERAYKDKEDKAGFIRRRIIEKVYGMETIAGKSFSDITEKNIEDALSAINIPNEKFEEITGLVRDMASLASEVYIPFVYALEKVDPSLIDRVIEYARENPGKATVAVVAAAGVGIAGLYQIWSRYTVSGNIYRLKSNDSDVLVAAAEALKKLGAPKEQLVNGYRKALENSLRRYEDARQEKRKRMSAIGYYMRDTRSYPEDRGAVLSAVYALAELGATIEEEITFSNLLNFLKDEYADTASSRSTTSYIHFEATADRIRSISGNKYNKEIDNVLAEIQHIPGISGPSGSSEIEHGTWGHADMVKGPTGYEWEDGGGITGDSAMFSDELKFIDMIKEKSEKTVNAENQIKEVVAIQLGISPENVTRQTKIVNVRNEILQQLGTIFKFAVSGVNIGEIDTVDDVIKKIVYDKDTTDSLLLRYSFYEEKNRRSLVDSGPFSVQVNPKRKDRAPSQYAGRGISQPFDEKGRNPYLKTKLAKSLGAATIDRMPVDFIVNVNPFAEGHFLILPEKFSKHPQLLNRKEYLKNVFAILKASGRANLKITFNSFGAFGTVNHLHFQGFYYGGDGTDQEPLDNQGKLPVENPQFGRERPISAEGDVVTVARLKDYPARALTFKSDDIDQLAEKVFDYVQVLNRLEIAYNILTVKTDSGKLEVFVFPRKYEFANSFGAGTAVLEMAGEFIVFDEEKLKDITTTKIEEELKKTTVTEEVFKNTLDNAMFTVFDKKSIIHDKTITAENPGGIDMNEIDIEKQGSGINVQFTPQNIQPFLNMEIEGFVPVIINLVPVSSILPLLGIESEEKQAEWEVSSVVK